MNVIETMLSVALIGLAITGMIEVTTQHYYARDALRVVEQIGVYQNALVRHQIDNPQDGVEGWFPAQCPDTHDRATTGAPRLRGGGCDLIATGTPPACPAGHTLEADRVLAVPVRVGTPPAFDPIADGTGSCPAGHTLDLDTVTPTTVPGTPVTYSCADGYSQIPPVPPATVPTCELAACRVSTCRMAVPTTGCPAGHTRVGGTSPACELDATWTEISTLPNGDLHLDKLDLRPLERYSFGTLMTVGDAANSAYGTPFRLLSNGVSRHIRVEFDVRGIEPVAHLLANNVYPGLSSSVDPLPVPGTHDENTVYTVAVHVRPALARTVREFAVDPVEIGNPGMRLGSALKFSSIRDPDSSTHRLGARCDDFRTAGVAGAFVVDANGMFLTCRDDPKGVVTAGPIWVASWEAAQATLPLPPTPPPPCGTCPPPAGTVSHRICPDTMANRLAECDRYEPGVTAPHDRYFDPATSGWCACSVGPPPPPPSDRCGLSITEPTPGVLNVQFYHLDASSTPAYARTNGQLVFGPAANFGLTSAAVPASDRLDAQIDTYLTNHPAFAAWVGSTDGQTAQAPIASLGCSYSPPTSQCGMEVAYEGDGGFGPLITSQAYFQNAPFLDDLAVRFFDPSTSPATYGSEVIVDSPTLGVGPPTSHTAVWTRLSDDCANLGICHIGDVAPFDDGTSVLNHADATVFTALPLTVQPADLATLTANNATFAAWYTSAAGQAAYDSCANLAPPTCTPPEVLDPVTNTCALPTPTCPVIMHRRPAGGGVIDWVDLYVIPPHSTSGHGLPHVGGWNPLVLGLGMERVPPDGLQVYLPSNPSTYVVQPGDFAFMRSSVPGFSSLWTGMGDIAYAAACGP